MFAIYIPLMFSFFIFSVYTELLKKEKDPNCTGWTYLNAQTLGQGPGERDEL